MLSSWVAFRTKWFRMFDSIQTNKFRWAAELGFAARLGEWVSAYGESGMWRGIEGERVERGSLQYCQIASNHEVTHCNTNHSESIGSRVAGVQTLFKFRPFCRWQPCTLNLMCSKHVYTWGKIIQGFPLDMFEDNINLLVALLTNVLF